MVTSDFRPEVAIWPFRACAIKIMQYNAYLWLNRRNFRALKEIGVEEHDGYVRFQTGSGNTAVSRMRNENAQYNAYLHQNRRNFRVLMEIGVEEHDGDVRFQTGSGNTAVSRIRHASGHIIIGTVRSLIVDVAMGQIPRSTERISSLLLRSICGTGNSSQQTSLQRSTISMVFSYHQQPLSESPTFYRKKITIPPYA